MKITHLLVAAAAASVFTNTHAADVDFNRSSIDLYYVPLADIELSQGTPLGEATLEDDGDGYGIKGHFALGENFFLSGEYQANDYSPEQDDNEELERDLNIYRGGLGFFFPKSPIFIEGEYIGVDVGGNDDTNVDEDEDLNGYGVHVGASTTFRERLTLKAKVGYVDIDDVDGVEYLVGASFNIFPAVALFADYRGSHLEGDSDNELKLNDLRTGISFTF